MDVNIPVPLWSIPGRSCSYLICPLYKPPSNSLFLQSCYSSCFLNTYSNQIETTADFKNDRNVRCRPVIYRPSECSRSSAFEKGLEFSQVNPIRRASPNGEGILANQVPTPRPFPIQQLRWVFQEVCLDIVWAPPIFTHVVLVEYSGVMTAMVFRKQRAQRHIPENAQDLEAIGYLVKYVFIINLTVD